MLNHTGIAARIPHQGGMCLLDGVLDWSPEHIRCRAISHRDAANPLRAENRLGAACGIEYAAQAMALHGSLAGADDQPPRQGYLVSVRSVILHVGRLDDIAEDIEVSAERISGDGAFVMYAFNVQAGSRCLVEGRASVVLDATALAPVSGAQRP